ncbi:RNA polymerase sigma factor [Dyadobacter sp. CY312]|uniref:RNA polymerase sigma factor n=1 Tax=Dyadobacter sp. CY312 TaxID=2907303 RepID=UPI001F215170|nr:sigma factor [Dyadobacter sp. CY312]MCE7042160.1 RNA polymerase subunit sigma-24 [Dyadobacter sp. CY312]
MTFPDRETLNRVTQGDDVAFMQVYLHFRRPALVFCSNLLKNEVEAENVIQDVFVEIWRRRSDIKPDCSFQSYLFASLRNQVFDQLRRIKKDRFLSEEYLRRLGVYSGEEPAEKEGAIESLKTRLTSFPKIESASLN